MENIVNETVLLVASISATAFLSYIVYNIKVKFLKKRFDETSDAVVEKYNEQKKNMFKDFFDYISDIMSIFSVGMFFNFDNFIQNTDYNLIGTQIFLTEGVVLDKKFISKDDMVDNIANSLKDNVVINTSDDFVKDYYIVKIVSKHNSKEYVFNNKSLYDNVEQSDIVFITVVDDEVHNIGFAKRRNG